MKEIFQKQYIDDLVLKPNSVRVNFRKMKVALTKPLVPPLLNAELKF